MPSVTVDQNRGKYQLEPAKTQTMNKHIIIAWENTNGQGVLLLLALHLLGWINRLSIECRKTKTKVITTVNQKEGKYRRSQWELLHLKTTTLPKARENAGNQVANGFASDWLREWREFSGPITNQNLSKTNAILNFFWHSIENYSKTKLIQYKITFDTQLWESNWPFLYVPFFLSL